MSTTVFTRDEVEALLVRLGEEAGADLLALARGLVPKLNETPLPAEDADMMKARADAIARVEPHDTEPPGAG